MMNQLVRYNFYQRQEQIIWEMFSFIHYTIPFKYLTSIIDFSKQNYLDSAIFKIKRVIAQETVILRKILNLTKSKHNDNYSSRKMNTRKVDECPCLPLQNNLMSFLLIQCVIFSKFVQLSTTSLLQTSSHNYWIIILA